MHFTCRVQENALAVGREKKISHNQDMKATRMLVCIWNRIRNLRIDIPAILSLWHTPITNKALMVLCVQLARAHPACAAGGRACMQVPVLCKRNRSESL